MSRTLPPPAYKESCIYCFNDAASSLKYNPFISKSTSEYVHQDIPRVQSCHPF